MHEMGIANSVLEAVRTEMERYPSALACKVAVRVGEMTAIDQDALRFCFEAITRDTDLESIELDIQVCPRRHRCRNCRGEFVVTEHDFCCPRCASPDTEFAGGDELELAYLEVEEYGASTAGTKSPQ